jgi:hypothetical protein
MSNLVDFSKGKIIEKNKIDTSNFRFFRYDDDAIKTVEDIKMILQYEVGLFQKVLSMPLQKMEEFEKSELFKLMAEIDKKDIVIKENTNVSR